MPIAMLLAATAVLIVQAATLQFMPPAGWKSRPAASAMRVAEFTVPRADAGVEDGEVVIYFFGGSGGTVDANIDRWVGQFRTAAGGPIEAPARAVVTIRGLKVTQVDVSGTYVAEVRPGSAERFNKPNFRMRAAVIETPKGPYFVKFTGPARTVARAAAGFDRFINSLRYGAR